MKYLRKMLCVLAVMTIIAAFVLPAGLRVSAEGDEFSFTITAVSGPVTGSIRENVEIRVMYGEPLVLKVTGSKPFRISPSIMNPEMNCSVSDISQTEKKVTISAKKQDSYAHGADVDLIFTNADGVSYKDSSGRTIMFEVQVHGEPFHVKTISLDKTRLKLVPGQQVKLNANVYPSVAPEDVEAVKIKWEIAYGESFADVSQDGTVTATAAGSAYVYAFPSPRLPTQIDLYASCYIEVVNTLPAESVAVALHDGSAGTMSEGVLTLSEGETAQLDAALTPENSTDIVSWNADGSGAATVDASGTVTAVSMGSSVITAQAGAHTGTLTVRVLKHHEAVPAACTSAGSVEYWEDANGGKYSDKGGTTVIADVNVPAPGHDWELVSDTPATCETDGEKAYTCKNDSTHQKTETVKAFGHKWDGGKVEKAATRHETGVMKYTCLNDPNHTKTEEIPIITDANGYRFVSKNHSYTKQSGKKVEMKVARDGEDDIIGKFEDLYIGGKKVDKSKYKAEPGSVKLTVDPSYLNTLKKGEHTVVFYFVDGYAESKLKITSAGSGDTPGTGDDTDHTPAVIGAILSFVMAAVYVAYSAFVLRRGKASAVPDAAGAEACSGAAPAEDNSGATDE